MKWIAAISFHPDGNELTRTELAQGDGILCQMSCHGCNFKPQIPFAYINGDFIISAFIPIHESSHASGDIFKCSNVLRSGETIELLEPALYAVDKFNDPNGEFKDNPLSGKVGIIIFDSCKNIIHTAYTVGNFETRSITMKDPEGHEYDPRKVIGYIGGLTSSVNLGIAEIIKKLNLIQLAYAATSTKLFNYDNFLRTIPADDIQAEVMIQFILEMKWKAFAIVYQNDAYGLLGYNIINKLSKEHKLCIAKSIKIDVNMEETRANDLLTDLYIMKGLTGVKVVILFVSWSEAYTLLKVANTKDVKKRMVWIGTESWATRSQFKNEEVVFEAVGAVTVMAKSISNQDLTNYMLKLKPFNNTRNPFFKDWWQQTFQCRLPNSNGEIFSKVCANDLTLAGTYKEDPRASMVTNLVLSLAKGVGEILRHLCPQGNNCDQLTTPNGLSAIVRSVRNIKLRAEDGTQQRVYRDRGDGIADYYVLNLQYNAITKTYNYLKVSNTTYLIFISCYNRKIYYRAHKITFPIPYLSIFNL